MERLTYERVREDHEYLWSIAAAYDMTGGYIDQQDLQRLLESPTKSTARDCYLSQINYWFQAGPDHRAERGEVPWDDLRVVEIGERYGFEP